MFARLRPAALVLACASCVLTLRAGQPTAPPPTALVDVVALDAAGRPVLDLSPADLTVRIDGQPRQVRSVRYVFRGAGADEAARGAPTVGPAAAVTSRLVVFAVDESTIRRGAERAVASGVWRIVDGLTPADLVGIVVLPQPRGETSLSQDREPLRAALKILAGRAEDPRVRAGLAEAFPEPAGGRQAAEDVSGEPRQVTPPPSDELVDRAVPPDALAAGRSEFDAGQDDALRTLVGVLGGLREVAGAKHLVYVTGGAESGRASGREPSVDASLPPVVDAAALARVTVHVVHVQAGDSPRPDQRVTRLASQTGGTLAIVGARRADTASLTAALSGGYVVEVERRPEDRADRPVSVAVTTGRKGVRLLAASRWASRDDPIPEPPPAAPAIDPPPASSDPAPARPAPATAATAHPDVPDAELRAVIARVGQYVDTCPNELDNLVAEESYPSDALGVWTPVKMTQS